MKPTTCPWCEVNMNYQEGFFTCPECGGRWWPESEETLTRHRSLVTKEELRRYRWLKISVHQLEDRLLELDSEATRMTTRFDSQPGGDAYNKSKLDDILIRKEKVENQINNKIVAGYDLLRKIEHAITVLPDREQCLIRSRYIDAKSWEQIADEMVYCKAQIHRIHGNAIWTLQKRERAK